MSIITFWNNSRKQIGQTVAASTIATYIAAEKNYKVLLMSSDYNDNSMENAFGSMQLNSNIAKKLGRENEIDLANGIEGLITLSQSNRLTPESIKNYTKIIFTDRLEVLYTPKNVKPQDVDELFEAYKKIINLANKYYDIVIVDLSKGVRNQETLDILKMSDIVVLNIEQGDQNISKLLDKIEKTKLIDREKMLIMIDRYDEESKYNTKNVSRTIWKGKPIYAVPYNTLLFEACIESNLPELMLRIRTVDDKGKTSNFVSEIKKSAEGIIYKLQELQMKRR
ncbi:MAG: hypothetical protein IKT41_03980 [Clostridia bacterium]|nr:hypothetical protein [Clostridia bacterium]